MRARTRDGAHPGSQAEAQQTMSQWPETSESLILRLRNPADALAWTQFVEIYQPVVYRLARMRGLQHVDAEDLCQQVLTAVSQAIPRWEPGSSSSEKPRFRNWLSRITRNAILNALSRAKPDRGVGSSSVQELLQEVPDNDEINTLMRLEGRLEAFRWAALQVKPEFTDLTWKLFYESTVAGRSAHEVAAACNRSPGAVYVARCRVMQRIKLTIEEVSDFWSDPS